MLDQISKDVLQFIIDNERPDSYIGSEEIREHFSSLSQYDVYQILDILKSHECIDWYPSDGGDGVVVLRYTGKTYFEMEEVLSMKQTPNITINNSSGFNIVDHNNIQITNGLTADDAIKLIEQSSLSDKEALKEVISLLNDSLENNKPIEPSKFTKALSAVTSVATLVQAIGGVVLSAIRG